MSDQIKTQHGTIGLLMAECEQLRRELAKAKAELDSEQKAHDAIAKLCFEAGSETADGTSIGAVRSLCERLEQARAENARLAAALKAWQISARTFEEMLAPTIELLHGLHGYLPEDDRAIRNELARLRSALTSSAKSDTNTP